MSFQQVYEGASAENERVFLANASPDDYVKDGLTYCHRCNTPKQVRLLLPAVLGGGERLQGCCCRCEMGRYEADRRRQAERDEMWRTDRVRQASMIDEQYARASFTQFRHEPGNARAFRVAIRYVDVFDEMARKNQGLLFWGPVGTGKSFVASCIANALMDKQVPVVMTSALRIMQVAYAGGDPWRSMLQTIQRARLLVIDDYGADSGTPTAKAHMFSVIDERYRAQRPLIVTTNLDVQRMSQAGSLEDERITDRILAMCYQVQMTGPSKRVDEAAIRYDQMRLFEEEGV